MQVHDLAGGVVFVDLVAVSEAVAMMAATGAVSGWVRTRRWVW
jgi:hypothetical protein